jgi:hypothetical protein
VRATNDGTVIPLIADQVANAANQAAIDRLVSSEKYPCIVAWGKWLGFTPETVLQQVRQAEADNAPADAIQKVQEGWLRLADITSEVNRAAVVGLSHSARATAD